MNANTENEKDLVKCRGCGEMSPVIACKDCGGNYCSFCAARMRAFGNITNHCGDCDWELLSGNNLSST